MFWSIVVYLHLWVKSLWACKKWVSCAPYTRMICLGYFLKESLIFVFFGFSFLNKFLRDSSNILPDEIWLPGFSQSSEKEGCGSQHSIHKLSLKCIIFGVILLSSPLMFPSLLTLFCPNHGMKLQSQRWVKGPAEYLVSPNLPVIKLKFTSQFQIYPVRPFPKPFGSVLVETGLLLDLAHCWL